MSHSEIQRRYSIEPKKSLGQNFLTNDHILASIAELKSLQGKHVIEVGPGYGALTEHILKQKPASLTLVEFDPKMIAILKDRYAKKELMPDASTEFEILHQDVLHFSPKQESIVVANIPYYITSPILFRFLYEVEHSPSAMVILMQQEVGDKIRESRGFGASYLSLACANRTSEIHEAIRVSPWNFVPPPKVESSVLVFETTNAPRSKEQERLFLSCISRGFAQPRKLALSNLSGGNPEIKRYLSECFSSMDISLLARPADISLNQWLLLAQKIAAMPSV